MNPIQIVEVGPRDGLQNEKVFIPTDIKLEFIEKLIQAGLHTIEITSFVSAKWVPQLADAEAVMLSVLQRYPQVTASALVPNMKGLEKALSLGVKNIAVFTAASETFNKKNINMSIHEAFQEIKTVISTAMHHGVTVRGYLSTCFYCPYEGYIYPDKVLPVLEALLNLGVSEISIGDTIGKAEPKDIELLLLVLENAGLMKRQLALHCHDTYGHAMQNIQKAYEMGITTFDSSAGGIGGCPYAPGASGNVATEAIVAWMQEMNMSNIPSLKTIQYAADNLKKYIYCNR